MIQSLIFLSLLLYLCTLVDFYSCRTLTVIAGVSRAWVMQTQEQDSSGRCQWCQCDPNTKTRCKQDHSAKIPTFHPDAVGLGSRSWVWLLAGPLPDLCRKACLVLQVLLLRFSGPSSIFRIAAWVPAGREHPTAAPFSIHHPYLGGGGRRGAVEKLSERGTIGGIESSEVVPKK